jgi:hypothetical protein
MYANVCTCIIYANLYKCMQMCANVNDGLFILGQQQRKLQPTQCHTVNGCEVCDRKPLQDNRRGTFNLPHLPC